MLSLVKILLFFLPGFCHVFESYSISSACSKNCVCTFCPITGLQNLTEISCNASKLQEIDIPTRNICSIVLSGNGISALDKKLFKTFNGILSLDLSFNLITTLSKRVFSNVPSLKRLYLNNNLIAEITQPGLWGLGKLNDLDLSFNLIMEMPRSKMFMGLQSITRLNISHNMIKALPGNTTFVGLRSLLELDLRYNRLEILTSSMFRGMLNLETLYLSNNYICKIDQAGLSGLWKLQYLDLSSNSIIKIPKSEAFSDLKSVLCLNMSHNLIKSLPGNMTFLGLRSLLDLDLSHNRFEILTSSMFRGLLSLNTLFLQYNNITTISSNIFFTGLRWLKNLFLNNNFISKIEQAGFSGLWQIEHLDLSDNQLKILTSNMFLGMPKLKTLLLNNNFIFKIEQAGLSGMWQLQYLDLSYNKLENVTSGMFLGLLTLRNLSLHHNNITIIQQKAFTGLRDLERLDLSYNRIVTLSSDVFSALRYLQHINLEGNNVTFLNNTVTQTQLQKPASEIKGCTHFQRERVVVHVRRNKTVCLQGNCSDVVVVRNFTKTVVSLFNVCWDITNKLQPLLFVLGTGAILSNLVVITTVIWAKNLRTCPPFLLVSEMAFCDFLVGIYIFGMAFGHGYGVHEFRDWQKIYCSYLRNLFIFAQVVGSLTSLLMTIERYVAIVFCMKPSVRLGRKAIGASLALFWIAGAAAATLVQILDAQMDQKPGQMCLIYRDPYLISTVFISEVLLLCLVFVYLVVVVLYVHIFIVVRKSARNLGVLRESKLAKRISLIVISSFVFFAAPNFSLAWFTFWGGQVFEDARFNRTLLWWLPPVCLVVNACLNPCIFAFKNDKFMSALRKMGSCSLGGRLTKKKRANSDQTYTVFSTVDSMATSQSSLAPGVELKMFNAAEEQKDGIKNEALELDISQA
ncbi:uncharacterized protein LOC144637498 isoform X2 [Oculina patagonica]